MTSDLRRKVLGQIEADEDKAIKFLQQMVTIPSVTGDEAAIQRFLADYMGRMGLTIDQWETDWAQLKKHPGYRPVDRGYEGRPNIVATWKGTGGGRSLLLNGHSDVIPVGNGEGWSDNPWSGAIKNGRLYGRGSADMKSGVASHIMAVASLIALGLKPKGDVYINVVIDEEVSGHGTLDTVIRGYKADAGISGETSDLAIQPACIGRIWFEIEINGKAAGIQRRYEGVSGIETRLYHHQGGQRAGGRTRGEDQASALSERDRCHPLRHRQLPGRQLSELIPGHLPSEGQHRDRSR